MSLLILRRVRTFGIQPFALVPLCFCLFVLPVSFAQSSSRLSTRVDSQVNLPSGVVEGLLLDKTNPVYPPIAKAARVSGTVVLQAAISKTGTIEGLHVVSGPAMLQQAAFDAVKTWRYKPYYLQGEPVKVLTTINVVFSLGGPDAPLKAAPSDSASPRRRSAGGHARDQFIRLFSHRDERVRGLGTGQQGWVARGLQGVLSEISQRHSTQDRNRHAARTVLVQSFSTLR
jgi:TonB family protein